MATYAPAELLQLWKTEQITVEMATGHLLQQLVKLYNELETQRAAVINLRADVDRLLVHAQLPPPVKGKLKEPKSDEASEQK